MGAYRGPPHLTLLTNAQVTSLFLRHVNVIAICAAEGVNLDRIAVTHIV